MKSVQIGLLMAAITTGIFIRSAHAGVQQYNQDFESPSPPPDWYTYGGAGFDYGKNLAHNGKGNAWVRATHGWNAVNVWVPMPPNSDCYVQAWIRLSPNLTYGYMTIRGGDGTTFGPPIHETPLTGPGQPNPQNANYNLYGFKFNSGNSSQLLFYVGLWGNGSDAWEQVDDVGLSCSTPF